MRTSFLMEKNSTKFLLQPISMEDKSKYLFRFMNHKEMISLFSDEEARRKVANDIFAERWENATVTVKKLNGEMFFID